MVGKSSWVAPVMLVIAMLLVTACSGTTGTERSSEVEEPLKEPVTLKLFHTGGYLTEEDFNQLIADPVKQKYPHLTVEMGTKKLSDLLSVGEQVDFYVTWDGDLPGLKEFEVFQNVATLAERHGLDLSRFDPLALEALKSNSEAGQLHALPYAVNLNALYYNKDIFDKFGVPYPADGMRWDDAIALAGRVTKMEDNLQYLGLGIESVRLLFPLSLNNVDAKTDKALVNSDPYKRVFELGKRIYSIPGNEYVKRNFHNEFIVEKRLAMYGAANVFLRLNQTPDLNWNIAQFPSYTEKPDTYGLYDLHIIVPLQTSKYPEDQARVMEVLFSDEVQRKMVGKTARISALKDPIYAELFGQELSELKGKRISSIFKSKPAPHPGYSRFFDASKKIVNEEFIAAMTDQKDINTALRHAEERINQHVQSAVKK